METQTVDLDLNAPIAEMAGDAAGVVMLDPARVQALLASTGDEKPEFPVLRVEEGLSGNNFLWTGDIFDSVAEQINTNEPVAYLGHIKPEDERWVFPDPQTVWLKAIKTKEPSRVKGKEGQIVNVLYVKGYNLPDAKVRGLIKARAVRSASWRGRATVEHLKGGIQKPIKFVMESFDWSRPGQNAMAAHLVTVAAEQREGSEKQVEAAEIAKLQLSDLVEHNPNLVTLIKNEGAAAAQTKIAEMEQENKTGDEAKTLLTRVREALGLKETDDVLAKITETIQRVEKVAAAELTGAIDKVLDAKIKHSDPDKVKKTKETIMRLLPVAEMKDLSEEDLKKKVDEAFDSDEGIKVLVAEMLTAPPPPTHRGSGDRMQSGSESSFFTQETVKV